MTSMKRGALHVIQLKTLLRIHFTDTKPSDHEFYEKNFNYSFEPVKKGLFTTQSYLPDSSW